MTRPRCPGDPDGVHRYPLLRGEMGPDYRCELCSLRFDYKGHDDGLNWTRFRLLCVLSQRLLGDT